MLQAHLLDERPDAVAELHRRASAWFEANDDTLSAISHALAGGDTGRAADLMELAMPRMRRERREADLARWMRALPDDLVRTRPVLAVAFVGALAQGAKFDTIAERLDQVEALVRSADGTWPEHPPPHVVVADHDHYRSLPAHVAMYRAALALASGDLDGTIAHARHALSVAPPQDPLVRAAAGALAGLASWSTGDLAGAYAAYTESVVGLTSAGFRADVLGCTITLGDHPAHPGPARGGAAHVPAGARAGGLGARRRATARHGRHAGRHRRRAARARRPRRRPRMPGDQPAAR